MTQTVVAKPLAGVLPISIAATQKASLPGKSTSKTVPRLKLLVRRLPPGLTQAEFENQLGDEWKVGLGRVDWFQFKTGKISKDPAKPSRPARAYLRLTLEDHIISLHEKIRVTSFQDVRNSGNDPVLLGPPSLEFAPYARVPSDRMRKDGRQGSIDLDPEFIDFLEDLTNPVTKPPLVNAAVDGEKGDEAMTTPLVQFIKEKKANKAKESAPAAKSSRIPKAEKESKPEKVQAKKLLKRPDKETPQSPGVEKKTKVERATKEAVKAANKQAASIATKAMKPAPSQVHKDVTLSSPAANPDPAPAPAPERKRERGDISAAAKILQRDLGLIPASGRRRTAKSASTTGAGDISKTDDFREAAPSSPKTVKQPPSAKPPRVVTARETGDTNSVNPQTSAPSTISEEAGASPALTYDAPAKAPKPAKLRQLAPSTATQAFLKHANPSQGVTEPLLEAAFAPFGKVLKAEIDKRKGFGYIDFTNPESLQNAIAASPVQVAQSQVVVLERKNPPAAQLRGKGRDEQNQQSSEKQQSHRGGKPGGKHGGGPPSQRGGRGPRSKVGGAKASGGANVDKAKDQSAPIDWQES